MKASKFIAVLLILILNILAAPVNVRADQTPSPIEHKIVVYARCKLTEKTVKLMRDQLLVLINAGRAKVNLPTLSVHPILQNVAQDYANYMAEHDFFSHHLPDGRTVGSRAAAAGFSYSFIGENLAKMNFVSAKTLYRGWYNSPTHHEILFTPDATQAGIGMACSAKSGFYYIAFVDAAP